MAIWNSNPADSFSGILIGCARLGVWRPCTDSASCSDDSAQRETGLALVDCRGADVESEVAQVELFSARRRGKRILTFLETSPSSAWQSSGYRYCLFLTVFNLLVGIIPVCLPGSVVQISAMCLVFSAKLILHCLSWPWRLEVANWSELVASSCIFLIFTLALPMLELEENVGRFGSKQSMSTMAPET